MKKPAEYFYPLYKSWEQTTYAFLIKLAKDYDKIEVEMDQANTDMFFKNLIKSQKAKNWKPFLKVIINQLRKGKLNLSELNKKAEHLEYNKGVEKWAVFIGDKRLCSMVDRVVTKRVSYAGSRKDLVEFIVKYILSQLLQDWRGPKLMLLTESLQSKKVRIDHLNRLLARWDFTSVFEDS